MRFDMWKSKVQKGAFLVLVAALLPVFLMLGSLSVDLGKVWYQHSKLQNAADAAVLAGAYAYNSDESHSLVISRIQTYLDNNYGKNNYVINRINILSNPNNFDNKLLGLSVSSKVAMTVARLVGINSMDVDVYAKARISQGTSDNKGPGVFGYALIGARQNTVSNTNGQAGSDYNALIFDNPVTHISGKVHVDGPIWCTQNFYNGDLRRRSFTVDKGMFSTSIDSDYNLWSNRVGNDSTYWMHVNTQRDNPYRFNLEYSNDDYLDWNDPWWKNPVDGSKKTWWHYNRLGYYDDSSDVVVGSNDLGKNGIQSTNKVNVNLDDNNDLTASIYEFVENYRKQYENNSLSDTSVCIRTDGNYSREKVISDWGFHNEVYTDKNWHQYPYKVVICDGDVYINDHGLYYGTGDNYMLIISLHGNVKIDTSGWKPQSLHALIYAPQGNVTMSANNVPVKGSIVAQSIYMQSSLEWDSFHFGENGGSTKKESSIILYPNRDSNYTEESVLYQR